MKKNILILSCSLLAVAIGVLFFISCEKEKRSAFKIVKMTGGNIYSNLSKNNPFNFDGDLEGIHYEDSIHAELVEEGDLLLIEVEESLFYYRYSVKDGKFLSFSVENGNLFVNNNLKSFSIDQEDINMDRFNAYDDENIQKIQSVIISDSIKSGTLPGLKKIATLNQEIGIIFEEITGDMSSVVSLFDPSWLVCDEIDFDISSLNNLSLVFIVEGTNDEIIRLSSLPSLQQIIFYGEPLDIDENIPVNTNLRSLACSDVNVYDTPRNLSLLKSFPNLEKLYIDSSTPIDISEVSNLKRLRVLILFTDSVTTGLNALDGLTELEWMNLPSNITDDDFRSFIKNHPKLKVAGIPNYKWGIDLQPLQLLKSLTCLNMYGDSIDVESLYGLKQLKYLGIPKEIFIDSTRFNQLKSMLPETVIVPNNLGICLGTGWLLFFIPLLAIVYFLFSTFRKNY